MKTFEESQNGYDSVIDCTGWKANTLNLNITMDEKNKFPKLSSDFSSVSYPNLYFIGAAAHGIDYKKSSGGFVHGFRYNIKALGNILNWKLTNCLKTC